MQKEIGLLEKAIPVSRRKISANKEYPLESSNIFHVPCVIQIYITIDKD